MPARENISNPPVTDHVKEGIEPKPELETMVVEDASNKDCEPLKHQLVEWILLYWRSWS
jgi:hypothetical protein